MTSEPRPLPCPFCTCDAEIVQTESMDHDGQMYPAYYVMCTECGCRTDIAFSYACVDLWNARAPELLARVAELEMALNHEQFASSVYLERGKYVESDNARLRELLREWCEFPIYATGLGELREKSRKELGQSAS